MKKSEVSIVASIIIFLAVVAIVIMGTTSKIPNFFRDKLGLARSNLDLEEEKDDKINLDDKVHFDNRVEYNKIITCLSDKRGNVKFELNYENKKYQKQTQQVLKLLHPKAQTRIYNWLKSVKKTNPEISVQLKLSKNKKDQEAFIDHISNKGGRQAIEDPILENFKEALKHGNFFYYETSIKTSEKGTSGFKESKVLRDPPNKNGGKILNLENYGIRNKVRKNKENKLKDFPEKNVDCSKTPNKCWCGVQIK